MATRSKVPAKSVGARKTPAKAAKAGAKTGAKTAGKAAAVKTAKTAKTPAKTSAAKTAGKARPAAKAVKAAKAAPAAKSRPAAKTAAAGKSTISRATSAASKQESVKAMSAKAAPSAPATSMPTAAPAAATPPVSAVPLPPPKPPLRQIQAVSAQELASAHEYLQTRSAGRSGEPIVVDGKPLLTEEQLLAMDESQYMNPEQLAFFRYRLQQMERELLSNADETTEHLRETVIVPDPADRATIEEEHALELRTRDRERKLLKKVQSSLQQIEAGEYGYCEETGEPIGIPRLLARPTATLSLEAQQRREIKQKLFGD